MKSPRHRWLRPRFSIRTLAVFVTLVCIYLAAWMATIRGVMQVPVLYYGRPAIGVPAPFVCWAASYKTKAEWVGGIERRDITETRQYYLWICGPKIKLPFESTRKI